VIGEPPLITGAVHVTVAWALPAVAETPVGALGTVAGVTMFDGNDGTELPLMLVATAVNV
jgi:hypothetical protein